MLPSSLSLAKTAVSIALVIAPVLLLMPGGTHGYAAEFVFNDLLSLPQYHVQLLDQLLPMSSVDPERLRLGNIHRQQSPVDAPRIETTFTEEQQKQNTQRDHPGDATYMIMNTPEGQRFSCRIPPKPVVKEEAPVKLSPQEIEQEERQSVKRGLELLEPLSKRCLFITIKFWTYEYCHKKHVRQYHLANINGKWQPDPEQQNNLLGAFAEPLPGIQGNGVNEGASVQKSFSKQSGTTTALQAAQDKKFLVQRWGNGDHCELIGKPRKIEVQYQCSPKTVDYIQTVIEPTTCSYTIVINTPKLCTDPVFQPPVAPEPNQIECRPLVTDEQYQRATTTPGTIDGGATQEPLTTTDHDLGKEDEPQRELASKEEPREPTS